MSDGGTVRISSANKLSAVVRKKTSFKVNVSSENADYDISAGDGFTLNIDKSDAANPLYVFTEASKATSKPDKASGEAKTVQTNIAGKTSSTHVVPAKQVPNTADSFSPFGTMMKLMGSLIVAVGAGMILKKH